MKKVIFIIISLLFFGIGSPVGAKDSPEPEKAPALTDEDKEVAAHMEMLELMKLLEDMDLLKEYDLLAEEKGNEKDD